MAERERGLEREREIAVSRWFDFKERVRALGAISRWFFDI